MNLNFDKVFKNKIIEILNEIFKIWPTFSTIPLLEGLMTAVFEVFSTNMMWWKLLLNKIIVKRISSQKRMKWLLILPNPTEFWKIGRKPRKARHFSTHDGLFLGEKRLWTINFERSSTFYKTSKTKYFTRFWEWRYSKFLKFAEA